MDASDTLLIPLLQAELESLVFNVNSYFSC